MTGMSTAMEVATALREFVTKLGMFHISAGVAAMYVGTSRFHDGIKHIEESFDLLKLAYDDFLVNLAGIHGSLRSSGGGAEDGTVN